MNCTNPVRLLPRRDKKTGLYKNLNPSEYPDGLLVPCGKCLQCRIKKRKEWAMRCLHEMDSHDDSVFITLTYNDNYLPDNASLRKADLQKFFKRLRKRLGERKIRYFACGEYGDQTQRPHYHAIIFGLSLSKDDKQMVVDSWSFCDWSNRSIYDNSFGMAEPDSISYVAQYIDKKYSGDLAEEEYVKKNREPVFKLSSLGIGRNYCDSNASNLRHYASVRYRGKDLNLPRYYLDRLGIPSELVRTRAGDAERKEVKELTGYENMTYDDCYYRLKPDQVRSIQDRVKSAKKQHDQNLNARLALKKKKY